MMIAPYRQKEVQSSALLQIKVQALCGEL